MKEIKSFHNAVKAASHETSRVMSRGLRNEARAAGWPNHVVRTMKVSYTDNGFQAHVHDAHANEAHDLEYGTPSTQPTAAVRRFANRTSEAEKFMLGRISKHLGDLL